MSNPRNTTNLTISEDLYNRINEIRTTKEWTFNEVIKNLCELEQKNNYIITMKEYSFATDNSDAIFRAIFKKNTFTIEYLTDDGYSKKIDEWNITQSDKQTFLKFIHQDYARCMLENIEVAVGFKKFDIYLLI